MFDVKIMGFAFLALLAVVGVMSMDDEVLTIVHEKADSTAVVVIDMQNDFCHVEGVFRKIMKLPDSCSAIVEPIKQVTDAAHEHDIPVYWIKADYSPGVVNNAFSRILQNWPPICASDWGRKIIDDFTIAETDSVVTKTSYNAFSNTTLATQLKDHGVDTVVVMGVATSICVESSVRGALFEGFHVVTVSNAVGDAPAETSAALQRMGMYYGNVATSDEVARAWSKVCDKKTEV